VADWHLRELDEQLSPRGWHIEAVFRGNDYDISASWKIVRGDLEHVLDFEGLDDLDTRPLERAYGVRVRDRESSGLYFGRRPSDARPNRRWEHELDALVAALDES
jgi:hypothetical protein